MNVYLHVHLNLHPARKRERARARARARPLRPVQRLPAGWHAVRRDDGQPDLVRLGRGEVIAGWDQGIVGMRVGGRRRLVVPPRLGYGSEARADRMPAHSTLVFDIQLVGVSEARTRVDPHAPPL